MEEYYKYSDQFTSQSNPRISVNLLVILVKILVHLLVKLTKLGQGGCHRGLGLQGRTTCRFHVPVGAMGAKGDGANEDGSPPPADEGSPPGVGPKAQGPMAPLPGGEIHSRGGSQGG